MDKHAYMQMQDTHTCTHIHTLARTHINTLKETHLAVPLSTHTRTSNRSLLRDLYSHRHSVAVRVCVCRSATAQFLHFLMVWRHFAPVTEKLSLNSFAFVHFVSVSELQAVNEVHSLFSNTWHVWGVRAKHFNQNPKFN